MVIQVCICTDQPERQCASEALGDLLAIPVPIVSDRSRRIVTHDDLVVACEHARSA
jgi:hypothetical protein